MEWSKPAVISSNKVNEYRKANPNVVVYDTIELALRELFDIDNPSKKYTKTEDEVKEYIAQKTAGNLDQWGSWFFFSWSNSLVHFPPKLEHRKLRTSRNKNLITDKEQTKLYDSTVLVAGMSVGSNVVESLVNSGIGGKIILADMDIIEPTNLNRIRASYLDVGIHKVFAAAKKISEIDPYIEQVHLTNGLTKDLLKEAIKEHSLDVIVDEVDSLDVKVYIRSEASKNKIPVVMATDNGEDLILDVERYDTEDIELFDGRIPAEVVRRVLSGESIPRQELGMIIAEHFVGIKYVSTRMRESLGEVGKTIPTWPQLGSSAAMSGVYVAAFSRYIILGERIKTLRIHAGPGREKEKLHN